MPESEKELIVAAQKGDREAFGRLYDRHVKAIYNFVYFKTQHKDTTEDLVSQTFFKVLHKIQSVDPERPFVSWLYKVAQNTVFDHYRAAKHTDGFEEGWDIADDSSSTDELDVGYDMKRVEAHLKTLPQLERDIIYMRVWQEMSYRDIAEVVDKSEANCKVIFSRSIQKIRESMNAKTHERSH